MIEGALAIDHQLFPAAPPPLALQLNQVSLEIPVLTTETRSLKSSLIRSVTGGRISRSGGAAVVTALQDVSLDIRCRKINFFETSFWYL